MILTIQLFSQTCTFSCCVSISSSVVAVFSEATICIHCMAACVGVSIVISLSSPPVQMSRAINKFDDRVDFSNVERSFLQLHFLVNPIVICEFANSGNDVYGVFVLTYTVPGSLWLRRRRWSVVAAVPSYELCFPRRRSYQLPTQRHCRDRSTRRGTTHHQQMKCIALHQVVEKLNHLASLAKRYRATILSHRYKVSHLF